MERKYSCAPLCKQTLVQLETPVNFQDFGFKSLIIHAGEALTLTFCLPPPSLILALSETLGTHQTAPHANFPRVLHERSMTSIHPPVSHGTSRGAAQPCC